MARREYTRRCVCAEDGCRETTFYRYDYQRDLKDALARAAQQPPWKCLRHSNPDIVLSLANPEITYVSEPSMHQLSEYDGRVLATRWDNSSFVTGPGFRAYAEDFPVGTQLIATYRVVLPPDYQPPEPEPPTATAPPPAPIYEGPTVDLDGPF